MKTAFVFFCCIFFIQTSVLSQELFALTEPASNMSTHSVGLRLNGLLMKEQSSNHYNTHLNPEVMIGVSKNWMAHADFFLSNANGHLISEGGSFYCKYRFFSDDDVHSHFRMAFFGRGSLNNAEIHQMAIDLNGHNSGIEGGLVATKLIHKIAISSTFSFLHVFDNLCSNQWMYDNTRREAINYTISFGKLMLPKEYVNYKQTNVNAMLECLAQTNLASGKTFVDVAPILQFIFLSQMRLDIGYRTSVINDLDRTTPSGVLFRMEYNFFSAF